MTFSDWRAARCSVRSIVVLALPRGVFTSQATPSMIKSGECVPGVWDGGISSICLSRSRK